MLTSQQQERLMSFNKRQNALIERFEKLAGQLEKAGVGILIDADNGEVSYYNEKPLVDGLVSGYENIGQNNPDADESSIEEITCLRSVGWCASMIFDKPYGIFRKGSVRRILKKEGAR